MSEELKGIVFAHAEMGASTSRADGSISFRIITPELRNSERGIVGGLHGKAVRVFIEPLIGETVESVEVNTELGTKTHGQRMRAAIFKVWQTNKELQDEPFDFYYAKQMDRLIEHIKTKIKE